MSSSIITEIQTLPHRLESEWASENPIIAKNYGAYSTDAHLMRVGDGTKRWSELSSFSPTSYIGPHAHTHFPGGSDPIDFSSLSSGGLESLHFNTNRATSTIWDGNVPTSKLNIYTFPNNFFGSISLSSRMVSESSNNNISLYLDNIKMFEVRSVESNSTESTMDYVYIPKGTIVSIKGDSSHSDNTYVSIEGGWI